MKVRLIDANSLVKNMTYYLYQETPQAGEVLDIIEKEPSVLEMVVKKQEDLTLPPLAQPVVCDATVEDPQAMMKSLENYTKRLAMDAGMYIICEMAKRWLETLGGKDNGDEVSENETLCEDQ